MYKLIVVDDEPNSCEFLANFIAEEKLGFEVVGCFGDGHQAWEYISAHPVDCVLTDIKLPNMTGLELARLIYDNKLPIEVVLISGYIDFEYARDGIRYDVFDYLLKPDDYEILPQKLLNLQQMMNADERFAKSRERDEEQTGQEKFIKLAEDYIKEHFAEPISRDTVAGICFMNPSYFGRYFKKRTGYTFIEYLTKTRMDKAVELLQENISVQVIAKRVGYGNQRHFIRIFKSVYGCTPREYRNKRS